MHQQLFDHFSCRSIVFTDHQKLEVQAAYKHRKYRKGQYILQQGDPCKHENFVLKGMLRTYLVDEKGMEHVVRFSPDDWWAGDLDSYYSGKPSSFNIDCLEDTDVLQITQPDQERLIEAIPKLGDYYRILYRNSVIAYNRRIASVLCHTALERYQEFINQYPQIEQRVANHQIASYLTWASLRKA